MSVELNRSARPRRFLLADHPPDLVPRRLLEPLSFERRRAGQELVEQHAQRIDVGARVDVEVVELGLLGRHVKRCAQHHLMSCVQRLLGQRLMHRLGQAEVDHLGHRLVVIRRDQDVRGLQVAVNDAFLVRVLKRGADLDEEVQPFLDAQSRGVAILGDRHALDVFHHEIGPARFGQSAVQDLGDIGVVHQRQRLAFGLEASQDGARIHSGLDQLECDLAANGGRLLGRPDRPHAPLADLLEQLVAAGDDGAGLFARRGVPRRLVRVAVYGPVDHVTGAIMGSEQSQYPVAQGWVAGAFAFQIRATFLGRQRHGGGEERFGAIGGLGHGLVLRSKTRFPPISDFSGSRASPRTRIIRFFHRSR